MKYVRVKQGDKNNSMNSSDNYVAEKFGAAANKGPEVPHVEF